MADPPATTNYKNIAFAAGMTAVITSLTSFIFLGFSIDARQDKENINKIGGLELRIAKIEDFQRDSKETVATFYGLEADVEELQRREKILTGYYVDDRKLLAELQANIAKNEALVNRFCE